ncbi:IGF-like family receptor 1 isoform X2 [Grammomys surdaster]|uniref:IGF-like family receptor 1 isoform X2 n=1 Tax=Grammomys surdaster TaxID=491861 RepID=UPI0010A02E5C|nr:IGF-like family receptor 1 isoform X2 [Grammomys surdaster]
MCCRDSVGGSGHSPQVAGSAEMGPSWLLWTVAVAVLLLTRAPSLEASRFCGHLEYWNPDKRCCSSCLQRFGPPACPDYEFTENCGLNDFGDTVAHPFKECSPGYCNPNGTELCSQCSSGAAAPTHMESPGRTHRQCRKKPIPPKDVCPLKPEEAVVSGSPGRWNLGQTTKNEVSSRPGFPPSVLPLAVLPLFLVLLLILVVVLLSVFKRKVCSNPCSSLAFGDPRTSVHWPCPGTLEVLGSRNRGRTSLLQLSGWELQGLASRPLSLLLDELEVLEELIMLLDPEPGPSGSMAYGTTRHLAARYGLPATWSTFAYSLRPNRSPLRALIEMVVAREPSATLGQLGIYLAQLGRTDALQVLSKLG